MVAIARQVGIDSRRPGIIRFYWRVSSQLGGDYLEFFIDSVRQGRISGTTDWQGQPAVSLAGQSYTITGSGTHTLKWRYTKNGASTGGSDCAWVDYVQSPSPTDWLTITYGYDSAGRRIEKAYDGQTVCKYLYDGGHIIADYDAIISMACGAGVQFLGELCYMRPIFPAVNTTFIGVNQEAGLYSERCLACNNCYLAVTGGICPVTMCPKGLLNGPCGGTLNGRCEVDPDKECAWSQIYQRLEQQGRLELIKEILPLHPHDRRTTPGVVVHPAYKRRYGAHE